MKKTLIIITTACAFLFLGTACTEKKSNDGVYSSSEMKRDFDDFKQSMERKLSTVDR